MKMLWFELKHEGMRDRRRMSKKTRKLPNLAHADDNG